jgi:hypothetical protein
MPLLDHFHPPLNLRRHWNAFHHAWATYISSDLNRMLPEGYFAEPNIHFGIEIDVAAFEEANGKSHSSDTGWTPPAPVLTVPFTMLTDLVEVRVFSSDEGPTLAGAIELVSPANKDRPANRDAFISKCATYLQQGVGLVVVDVVTDRHGNLHRGLLERFAISEDAGDAELYAVAYRPVLRAEETNLAMWPSEIHLGQPLPTLPLWLRGEVCLRINLESTYERTCQEQRVGALP